MAKKARIIKDAPTVFMKEQRKIFRDVSLPKEAQEHYERLQKLAGMTFEIEREYGDRIVLKYPPSLCYPTEDGKGTVCAIDLEQHLVEKV